MQFVGDFFDVFRGSCPSVNGLKPGGVPVISATSKNNGIIGYYDVPAEYENVITVSVLGDVFYHDYPFSVSDRAAFVLVNKFDMPTVPGYPRLTRIVGMTLLSNLVSSLRKCFNRYNYAEQLTPDKIKREAIVFPELSYDSVKTFMSVANSSLKNSPTV